MFVNEFFLLLVIQFKTNYKLLLHTSGKKLNRDHALEK